MAAPRKHSEEVRDRIRDLAARGVNATAISRLTNVPRSSIRGILAEARPEPETPLDRMHSWLVWWATSLPGAGDAESIARRVRAMPTTLLDGPKSSLNPAFNPKLAAICKETSAAHVRAAQAEPWLEVQTEADAAPAATVKP